MVVPDLFPNRPSHGNAYLNEVTVASSLMDRLTKLIDSSNVYIALPGSVGTVGELVLVWNHINIDYRVHATSKKHLLCWRLPFEKFISCTSNALGLVDIDLEHIHFVEDPESAVELVKSLLPNTRAK